MKRHIVRPVTLEPQPAEKLYRTAWAFAELAEFAHGCDPKDFPTQCFFVLGQTMLDALEEVDQCFRFE
jgi:hypothetical protein